MRLAGMVVLDGLYDDLTTQEMSIKGHFEQQTPYEFAAAMESDTLNTFYVIAKGVPFDVCIEVKNRKPQWAEQIVANDEQDTCIDGENNDMGFFFNDELVELADACRKDSDCGHCSQCVNNRCKYGFMNQSGDCWSCDDPLERIINIDKDECHRCPNRMWSTHNGGRCVLPLNHDINYWNSVPKEECEKFPNHYSVRDGGACFYCEGNFNPTTGVCDTVDCHRNKWDPTIFGSDEDTCNLCGGSFSSQNMTDGGKVGRCRKEGGWSL